MGEIISWDDGRRIRENLWAHSQVMVFTNGLFDILHVGHLRMLRRARALGDVLVVGVNSDASALAFKGPGHPLVPQAERAELLAALAPVDFVIVFDEVSAERLVDLLCPDVYVKGGDYSLPQQGGTGGELKIPPEAQIVLRRGGEVKILPYEEGHSSSDLIGKVLTIYGVCE